MLTDVSLIKVKTLSKKMASQIQVVHWNYDPVAKEIHKGFMNDTVRPIAWACGEVLYGIPDNSRAWLVDYEGQLYWINAPYGGKVDQGGKNQPEWMTVCCKNLPQVFIG